jgi:predicted nuclease of restriction endonuclease-like (RecB) superfamily
MKNITQLISTISDVHSELQASAANAINKALTVRNWLIGFYIVEYEQKGEDRAEYGAKLMSNLAKRLSHIKGLDERSLRNVRQFYLYYNYLEATIRGLVTPNLQNKIIWGSLTPDSELNPKVESLTPFLNNQLKVPANVVVNKLSYTHFEALLKVSDPFKRTFYELESIKGTWSVRELKRQISSLYFERSGLSQHPEKLAELVQQKIQPQQPKDIIKNIYAFEFLDIGIQSVVEESDLETALLNHLQQFIIELGNGFCLEARQKRILIGETYYFTDLVFYHRILKCHVLVELKIGAFEHGDIGQLNTYLNYFKQEISEANDNPPVGILLVAEKDHALVKYATAGMDENLFVQQYLVQLPNQEQLAHYIENELKHFSNE